MTFNLSGTGGLEIQGTDILRAVGTVNFTDGFVDGDFGGVVEAQGNVVMGGLYNGGNAKLQFTGTGSQSLNATAATNVYNGDIEVNKPSGTVSLLSNVIQDAASQQLLVTGGTIDLNGRTLTNTTAGVIVQGGTLEVGTAAVVSMTMSSGYLLWALRSGYLLVGLASSAPVWSNFDPLPVLRKGINYSERGDEESLVDVIDAG